MPSTLYNPDGTRTGLRINAKVRRARMMGGNQGPLSTRPKGSEQWDAHERSRARLDFGADTAQPAPAQKQIAPSKPEGMLVPGPGGSAVWRTNAQLDEERQVKERAAARRRAGTPGTAEFVGPMAPKKPATFEGVRGIKGYAASKRV
jgi:hypothetical protein